MKKFHEWVVENSFTPGQNQINPNTLDAMQSKVTNDDWHSLLDVFDRQYSRFPNDPKVQAMGQALYQAAQSGDMTVIKPYLAKHVWAQPLI